MNCMQGKTSKKPQQEREEAAAEAAAEQESGPISMEFQRRETWTSR